VNLEERDLTEVFQRSPLQEVALELQFPPLYEVSDRVTEFQETIRADFPRARTGEQQETGQPLWEFETAPGGTQLRVSPSLFAFISTQYTSYDDFQPSAFERVSEFLSLFDVEPIRRIGLRYVNAMPLGPQGEFRENLKRFFHVDFDPEIHSLSELLSYRFEGRFERGENQITVRSGAVRDDGGTPGLIYLLDMDSYRTDVDGIEGWKDVVNSLHHDILREFHRHVKDEFLNELRKPPEEWS